jgi:hypothetical protein
VDNLAFYFFKKQFLNSCLALQYLLFVAPVWGGQCEFICEQFFFATANSNFFFMQSVLHFQTPFVFQFIALCVLFVAALSFTAAPYMGFGVRLAGRCPAPGSGNAIWLLFGAGQASPNFLLLPFTFISLFSSGSGAGH